ncbi:hypothetical protein PIB30_081596 [Stylosanthes scabra]|uniref:Uncharacterized protein n=1 Tax=Stylosanthes scabra TaxID=79078 RepID=A0ABU6TSE1_9FABA|nr:hypothetical protein [Stylosanthes scabra]
MLWGMISEAYELATPCMWLGLGWLDGVLGYSMVRRKSRVSIELGIQKYEARRAMEMRIVERVLNIVLEEVLREEDRFPVNFGSKRFESFKVSNSAECSRAPGNRLYCNRVDFLSHFSKENGISRRIDSAEARVDSTFEISLKRGPRFSLFGIDSEVRTVVVRDMYWTGRVGYDNRPGELTLAFRHFIRTGNPWLGILIPYVFETFQVQVQAWKVAKRVVDRCGLGSPPFEYSAVCLMEN